MKITKYNRKKDVSATNNDTSSSSFYSSSGIAQSLNTTPTLEKHTLWGLQFDGTSDVSGDISNAGNIEANGDITVNSSTDNEGKTIGGNITADGSISGGDIKANSSITSKTVNASESVTTNVINSNSITAKDSITTKDLNANTVTAIESVNAKNATVLNELVSKTIDNSDTITTKNLEVTGKAHFFELLIDKIKSVGGLIILSGANAVIDKVDGLTLYWKCKDSDGKQISNDFIVNDLIICQTFNAATGNSYNASNKYYWGLVKAKGTITLSNTDYHYITLDSSTYDGTLKPEVGDNIALLGYRGNDDTDRLSAIILSAYKSPDSGIKAPSIVLYKGINDFDLSNHRLNVIADNENYFTGEFHIATGLNLQDMINKKVNVYYAYSTSEDGSLNFSTTEVTDALYIGTYIGYETQQPTDPTKYIWINRKGVKGDKGDKGDTPPIYALNATSGNNDIGNDSRISFNGKTLATSYYRGHTIYFLRGGESPSVVYTNSYDTYGTPSLDTDLATYLTSKEANAYNDCVLVIIGFDALSVNDDLRNALKNYGYGGDNLLYNIYENRTSFVFIGQKGMTEGTAYYKMSKDTKVSLTASVSNGVLIGTGHKGDDGLVYKLNPLKEEATVILDNGTKKIKRLLYYLIYKYTNNVPTIITDGTIVGYWGSSEMSFTKDSQTYKVDDVISYTNDVQTIKVNLKENDNVVDSRTIPVVFANKAVIDVTDDAIKQAVLSGKSYTDGLITTVNNKITSVETTANGLKTLVKDVSTKVDSNYSTLSNKITSVETTANGLTTTVLNVSGRVDKLNGNYSTLSSKISLTADSITTSVVGSNVIAGIGNGNYWNGYTSFDENGFTFNFTSNNYLVSPVFTDYSGTYTLSFVSWQGTINVEVYQFTTLYKTTDNPDFSSGTRIASISTNSVDNNNPSKMHYSSELKRYYFTFKETTGAARAFRIRFSTPDSANAIQKVQVEDGEVAHLFNDSYANNQSQIKQTADAIELKVNDVSLKLSDGIELNGDTKVNGSVTIKDENTGFLLTGSNGTTLISPKSIGNYIDFYNKAEVNNSIAGSALTYGDLLVTQQGYLPIDFSWNFTRSIGIIPKGKTVTFNYATITFMKPNSGTVLNGSNISFNVDIYEGGNKIKSFSSGTTKIVLSNQTYVSTGGEITLNFHISARFDSSFWEIESVGIKKMPLALCNWTFAFDYPRKNFQLIGYDGFALNFGNSSMVYLGPEASVLKYGDYELKISTEGILRHIQLYKLGDSKKSHIHGSQTFTDTVQTRYISEYCPINGYNIRETSLYCSGGNVYIDALDDVIDVKNNSGCVNIFLGAPYYFIGKRILIKKTVNGGDMDVYAGYSTVLSAYKIIRSNTASTVTKYTDQQYHCRAYFSDGTNWIEEWLSW